MSKYDQVKFLKVTKARNLHICESCQEEINKGEMYYRESIGKVNAPGFRLRGFCSICYEKHGERLLTL